MIDRLWQRMAPREQRAVAVALGVVGLALLWSLALGPALATLRNAPAQHSTLDAQLQRMAVLRAQAQALQAQPGQDPGDSLRQLEAAVRQRLGPASRLVLQGDRATVTLSAVPADALAQWLVQARTSARAVPGEARLSRNAAGLWDGTVVLTLPPR